MLRRALTEEPDLVQLFTVDRNRHCFAEADVAEDGALSRIFMRYVETKRAHRDLRTKVNLIAALVLILEKDRRRGQLQRLRLVVNFAVHQLQDPHFVVVDINLVLGRDIRQLLALRIHLVEIRVGDQIAALGRIVDIDVRFKRRVRTLGQTRDQIGPRQHRRRGIRPVRVAIVGLDRIITVFKPKRLRVGIGIRVKVRMELAIEVLGLEPLTEVRGEVGQKTRLRRRQVEDHRLVIGRIHRHRLAGDRHIVLRRLEDICVQHQIIVPELHVRRGERRTVRPFVALAKLERQLREIVVPGPAFRDIRHDGLQVVRIAHKIHVAHGKEVRCAGFGGV